MSLVTALEAPLSISNAIKKASRATGADFSYLLKTAARESAFNKSAKAKTSSAAGLFQFIESTWLKTVKDVGDRFGLKKYTPHIFRTRSGRYYVPNEKLRQEILQLRHNPEVSAMMAGAFTQQNSEFVEAQLGREPSQGELYIAHFLGPQGAAELISLAESNPNARADRHFPRAAQANQPIFYRRGKPQTVAQVYKNLVRSHMKLQATADASDSSAGPDAQAVGSSPPAQIASAAPRRLVVEPVNGAAPAQQVAPTEEDLKGLVHKAALKPAAAQGAKAAPQLGPGVETRVVEASASPHAVGLLGQMGSPLAPTRKVAALSHNGLGLPGKTVTDAPPPGSIGAWTTIVYAPGAAPMTVHPPEPLSEAKPPAPQPSNDQTERVERRRTRAPGLLEQSAGRNAAAPAQTPPPVTSGQWGNFWQQMALNGS